MVTTQWSGQPRGSGKPQFAGSSRAAWFVLFISLAYLLPALFLFLWFVFVDQKVGLGPIGPLTEIPVIKAVPTLALIGIIGSGVLFLMRPYEQLVKLLPATLRENLETHAPIQRRQRQSLYWGYSFALPWIIGFLLLTLYPMVFSLIIAFFKWDIVRDPQFVGFDNFTRLFFRDKLYDVTIKNDLFYAFVQVPAYLVVSLGIALLMNQAVRGIRLYRTLYYLPSVLAGPAILLLYIYIFDPSLGVVNQILRGVFNMSNPPLWFQHEIWSKPTFIMTSLFYAGTSMVIYLAGLQGVPRHLYEAAEVDGANRWFKFWNVTLPMITPTIFFNLVLGFINAFQIFEGVYVITEGGPLNSTYFYAYLIYEMAFENLRMGYASAMAWILFLIIMFLTMVQFKLATKWVYYEAEQR